MARVLVISSHVATGDVGGIAQVVALAKAGIEAVFIPTVLYGRHPGHGPPGGGPVDAEILDAMLAGIAAQGVFAHCDAVLTGYFAGADQVCVAARAIDAVRAASPSVRIIVDPIMGDFGKGLYVKPAVADAIAADLVARADLVAPNAWELARLTGLVIDGPAGALAAARALGRPVLVSSVDVDAEIGVIYADAAEAWLATHRRADQVPNGTGDLLTALFAQALLSGVGAAEALQSAVEPIARQFTGAGVRISRLF